MEPETGQLPALAPAWSSCASIPGLARGRTRCRHPPKRARTQLSASPPVNASYLLVRDRISLSSTEINPIFGRIAATCVCGQMQSDRRVSAYALRGPCLARGKVVEIVECVVLAATSCCWDLFVSRQAVERELHGAPRIELRRRLQEGCGPVQGHIAMLTADCGAQAAVSMSFQLAMPPLYLGDISRSGASPTA